MSKIGYVRGRSQREIDSAKEYRAFLAEEEKAERLKTEKEIYSRYAQDMREEQAGTPAALQVPILQFEEFRQYIPQDPNLDALAKGAIAVHAVLQNQARRTAKKQAENALPDFQLVEWGFDLTTRPEYTDDGALRGENVGQAYQAFLKATPGYDLDFHWDTLQAFFARNKLVASLANLTRAWEALTTLNLVPEKPEDAPAPISQPARKAALPGPEKERAQRRHDYFNKVVKVDELTKREYTEAALNAMSASEYKRVMIGEFKSPTFRRDLADPWVK